MAHKKVIKEKAKQLYCIEGKTIDEIGTLLRIPDKTIYKWKKQFLWDDYLKTAGNVGMAMELQNAFAEEIQIAIAEKKLTDPATADALYKTSKMLEKLLPKKIMLANIFNLLEDIVIYTKNNIQDDKFVNSLSKYIPEIADFLRRKYND